MVYETTIKVSAEFKQKLKRLKKLGQTYEEYIRELCNL